MTKTRFLFFISFLLFLGLGACNKPAPIFPEPNATVINYCLNKAYCQYGYTIIYKGDTIQSCSPELFEKLGRIETPVKINITAQKINDFCKYPLYNVHIIENSQTIFFN